MCLMMGVGDSKVWMAFHQQDRRTHPSWFSLSVVTVAVPIIILAVSIRDTKPSYSDLSHPTSASNSTDL